MTVRIVTTIIALLGMIVGGFAGYFVARDGHTPWYMWAVYLGAGYLIADLADHLTTREKEGGDE